MDIVGIQQADFEVLTCRDSYALYFNHLGQAFTRLVDWYRQRAVGGDREAVVVRGFVDRLLRTVQALRFKYTHHPAHSLKIDLTDSGFPSSVELVQLGADLVRRDGVLRELLPADVLRRKILDELFRRQRDPAALLWQLSQRTHLELLDESRLFLTFTPGELRRLAHRSDSGGRPYLYSWGCFDFVTSRPYVHLMSFDQDAEAEPLEKHGPAHARLLAMIQAEGSRAPRVAVLAAALDAALPEIHPKVLKRICLGPLFSRFLVDGRESSADPLGRALCALLSTHGRRDDDFVMFFDEEIVFSRRQVVSADTLREQVREIFHIPETDPDAYRRGASVFQRSVLMAHHLMQHVAREDDADLRELDRCNRIVYTERGGFHGV